MSEAQLTGFYQAYKAWLDNGAQESYTAMKGFTRRFGLCTNLRRYCTENDCHGNGLLNTMMDQFKKSGLDNCFPFNDDTTGDTYTYESLRETMHLNPARIQWVNDHAQ